MLLSRELLVNGAVSLGPNVQSESKRSKRSRKSRIIDVDVTPCITLGTIQEDVPTYQSEPVESVFCSVIGRAVMADDDSSGVSSAISPGSPNAGVGVQSNSCASAFAPLIHGERGTGTAVTADDDSSGLGSAISPGSSNPRVGAQSNSSSNSVSATIRVGMSSPSRAVHAYTDGGCINNGQIKAYSAWDVVFLNLDSNPHGGRSSLPSGKPMAA